MKFEKRMKEFNDIKQMAFDAGRSKKIINKTLVNESRRGKIVEIAVCNILGLLSKFMEEFYQEEFNVVIDHNEDIANNTDIMINDIRIDIKSRDPMQFDTESENMVSIVYTYPGAYNIFQILKKVDLLRPIPNSLITEINFIWEVLIAPWMAHYNIYYMGKKGKELSLLETYYEDFPELDTPEAYDVSKIIYTADNSVISESIKERFKSLINRGKKDDTKLMNELNDYLIKSKISNGYLTHEMIAEDDKFKTLLSNHSIETIKRNMRRMK